MDNIFENAKFGDIYQSNDGTKHSFCSFTNSGDDKLARLYRENWGVVIAYLDGTIHSGCSHEYKIRKNLPDDTNAAIESEKEERFVNTACELTRKEIQNIINLYNLYGKTVHNIDGLGEMVNLDETVKEYRKSLKETL